MLKVAIIIQPVILPHVDFISISNFVVHYVVHYGHMFTIDFQMQESWGLDVMSLKLF